MEKEETPEEHKVKHKKEVQDLWEEIEKRDRESVSEHHDEKHKEEEELPEESEEEKEEE